MAFAIIDGGFTVSDAVRLEALGLQTDPFNDVYGGETALFDFSTMGSAIANGGSIPNMIDGGAAGQMSGFSVTDIQVKKGIRKSAAATVYAVLPAAFDLLTYGTEPDILISAWMTHEDVATAVQGILGYASNTGTERQWAIYTQTPGIIRFGVGTLSAFDVAVTTGAPYLHTIYVKRTGTGTCTVSCYLDGVLIGSGANTYPFRTPAVAAWKGFGALNGFNSTYKGVLHRIMLMQVAPSFDIDGWLATEIANNPKSRFLPTA